MNEIQELLLQNQEEYDAGALAYAEGQEFSETQTWCWKQGWKDSEWLENGGQWEFLD